MTKLVFGCGYLGRRIARVWLDQGEHVAVVTRSDERAKALREEGFFPLVADVSNPESVKLLPPARTVLYSIGYDRTGDVPRRDVVVVGLQNVLDGLPPEVERFLFISSTGVMGGHDGRWVDEASSCNPQREAGRCGLEAETLLRSHKMGQRAVILRLAGIYGPRRLPKLADVRGGRQVAAPDGAYLNLIHVDDAVEAILAAEKRARAGDLYLVSDGSPTGHRQFYSEMARQLQVGPLEFCVPEPGSRGAAAASGNKRVSNQKMIEELKVALSYPSFREGLEAICIGLDL
jgi:nucleoside-diphosphate-sugar epimerase